MGAVLLGVAFGLVLVASASATHGAWSYIYAGPKTWLPNYWEDSQYDTPGNRHYANAMQNINPEGCYRVAFIDGNGGVAPQRTLLLVGRIRHRAELQRLREEGVLQEHLDADLHGGMHRVARA